MRRPSRLRHRLHAAPAGVAAATADPRAAPSEALRPTAGPSSRTGWMTSTERRDGRDDAPRPRPRARAPGGARHAGDGAGEDGGPRRPGRGEGSAGHRRAADLAMAGAPGEVVARRPGGHPPVTDCGWAAGPPEGSP